MTPARLLSEAKNACGDRAVEAAKREDHRTARMWRALAVECDRLLRDAIAAEAAGIEKERV